MNARGRFIFGAVFFGCMIILWVSGVTKYATLEEINHHADLLKSLVDSYYIPAVLIYCAIYIGAAGLALPVASMLTFVSGFLFGMIPGFIYTMIAGILGAVISFLFMRYLFAEFVEQRYGAQLKQFSVAIKEQGYRYLLLVRLIPVVPFFLVNMVAACLPISARTFTITTAIGIIPICAIYSYAGQELSHIKSLNDIFTVRVIAIFVCLILIGLAPFIIEQFKKKRAH